MLATSLDRRFSLVAMSAALAWLGMFIHNMVDLPSLTPLSPENTIPALITVLLLIGLLLLPAKRAMLALLLGWGVLHLVGGALSVLPLSFLPFEPAQTVLHYTMHSVYALAQLPLIGVLIGQLRVPQGAYHG